VTGEGNKGSPAIITSLPPQKSSSPQLHRISAASPRHKAHHGVLAVSPPPTRPPPVLPPSGPSHTPSRASLPPRPPLATNANNPSSKPPSSPIPPTPPSSARPHANAKTPPQNCRPEKCGVGLGLREPTFGGGGVRIAGIAEGGGAARGGQVRVGDAIVEVRAFPPFLPCAVMHRGLFLEDDAC
jgi:hypothetical protein